MRSPLLVFLLLLSTYSYSQGIYDNFGQNSTEKRKLDFSIVDDQVEIIYYKDGENLARYTLDKVLRYIPEYENRLNYNLSNGIRIVVFNNFEDFRKSNLNITNPQYYAGGYSSLNDNSSYVYFDGNHVDFDLQIRKAVAEVLINESIFGGNLRERIQTAALLQLPDWYYKGLVAYLAESWNVQNDNILKDFFQNQKQKYFTSLRRQDEILAGHSIWRFIEEKYGRGAVSNIVFMTRIYRNVEQSVMVYTEMSINSLLNDWQEFYLEKYKNDENIFKLPKGQENAPERLAKKKHTQFKLSADGKRIAIVTNNLGKWQVVIYVIDSKTMEVITKGGHELLNRDLDYNYPLIAWNPDGNLLNVVLYMDDKTILKSYSIDGKLVSSQVLDDIPFVKEFSYSPDGSQIIFSVIENGQSDLVLYDVKGQKSTRISNDIFDNLNPRFSRDGSSVYYVSNKHYLSHMEAGYFAIYKVNIHSKISTFVIGRQDEKINCTEPIELISGMVSYLSDKNGIINNFVYNPVSGENYMLTNYKRCILHDDIALDAPVIADLLYFNNRYRIYVGEVTTDYANEAITNAANTSYRKLLMGQNILHPGDSAIKPGQDTLIKNDSIARRKAPEKVYISGFDERDDMQARGPLNQAKNPPLMSVARINFGLNYFLQQFDNSILNSYLFPAGVSELVYNYPLLSPHVQASISDLLKNHVIVAGIRIPLSIKASDYYLSYTNRKGRWDKEYSGFRRGRILDNERVPVRMITGQVKAAFMYPFNERSRFEINVFGRNDRVINQALDSAEILKEPVNNVYIGHGFEYLFDNVRSNGLNLFQGLRFRIYNENYHLYGKYQFISNNGFDGRYYQKVHRQVYLALRLSGAISAGTQTTAYYLGGVENWILPARSSKNFNYEIPTLTGSDYAFQTIVSPARGFLRNSRGGNKYVLFNAELRVPLFAYLSQRPISSEFFRSVMLIGFTDIGTAWKGPSPYSIENPFNTRIVQSSQYTVTVVSQRDPFLYSFGFGARAKILGHYVKMDYGWGLIENKLQKGMVVFSVGLDF